MAEQAARVVLTVGRAHRAADYYEESDTRYALRSCAYHVERFALYYAEHTQFAEEHEQKRQAGGQNRALIVARDDCPGCSTSKRR